MIREYNENDYNKINVLGRDISNNYMFDKTSDCFVFEENDSIIGFISYKILVDRAEIIDLFVHINYRNQSIGSKLLESMIDKCNSSGCKSITLEVKVTNIAAIELYKKYEFKIISTRKQYYENNSVDAHLMYREL